MDKARILDLLRKTTDPDGKVREPAEQQLNAIYKIIGFCPTLLECVLHPDVELHIKQAAVIYLKNNILKYWDTRHLTVTENGHTDPSQFIIHEQDKEIITKSIVHAIVSCRNELISVHLSSIVNSIIKSDFPHKWPNVVDEILDYLRNEDPSGWSGALITFHQLAKIYEYRNQNDRKPFLDALARLLPVLCHRLAQLLQSDPFSEQSCKLQKQVLKSFHATLQYSLPLGILSREIFTKWMELITEIAKRDVPEAAQHDVDKEDRPNLIWWKCKKWSLHLLARIFERYGSPNSVQKEYKEFANWYIEFFSEKVIQTIIKILEQYALGQYVSPRVMQQALNYLNTAVLHSKTWKMLKNDMMTVVEKIIFPLMCHSDADEELWFADPHEYIRMKFDIFEEYVSPVSASQNLLHSLCKKRQNMLQKTMEFVIKVLNQPQTDPRAKDGALHMVGSIADVLKKNPTYWHQMEEQLIAAYVFPMFSCTQGFLRARACWMLNHFSSIEFKTPVNIINATGAVLHCITADTDLPVQVEASLCLQSLLHSQPASREVVRPHIQLLTNQLVSLIRATESEDVMEVLQKIVYLFPDDLIPIAEGLTNHLAQTFHSLIESNEADEEEKISAAMAILSTIDTVLTMMDEQKDVIAKLEPIVVNIILKIFERNTQELYEEATTLLSTITADAVSDESWRVFQTLYAVFKRDGMDYFTDMMSPIHNYVTVDPKRFIASEQNVIALYDMCQTIMSDPNGTEEMESYAAKLLEIIILQFREKLNRNLLYSIVELAVTRLRREIGVTEYRTLLLQIVIAVLYVDHHYLRECFERWENQNGQAPFTLFNSFMEQWLKDVDELQGIHDRKINLIGFCVILTWGLENECPPIIPNVAQRILTSIISLGERLVVAYKKKAEVGSDDETESSDEEDDDSGNEAEVLADDQDHVARKDDVDDDDAFEDIAEDGDILTDDSDLDDIESNDDCEPTALESFETLIDMAGEGFADEFMILGGTLDFMFASGRDWCTKLWDALSEPQRKSLCELKRLTAKSLLNSRNNEVVT